MQKIKKLNLINARIEELSQLIINKKLEKLINISEDVIKEDIKLPKRGKGRPKKVKI